MREPRQLLIAALAACCALGAPAGTASAAVSSERPLAHVVEGLLGGEGGTTTSTTSTSTTSTSSSSASSSSSTTSTASTTSGSSTSASGGETTTTGGETTSTSTSSATPAPEVPASSTTTTTTTTTAPAPTGTSTTSTLAAPAVESSSAQPGSAHAHTHTRTSGTSTSSSTTSTAHTRAARHGGAAPPPGRAGRAGLPPLPLTLRTPVSGVPGLFIESLDVPPFLLPIYQAAGIAYEVPWEVLAAINEVETDYGNDLAVSSAGAEGWMQFLPSEWSVYGVDATGSGWKDPNNPADAIFAAARYLQAAGAAHDVRAAIFSYNHSQAYVEAVMLRARLLERMPPDLLGAVTTLAEARFPVHAPSHFSDGFAAAPKSATTTTLVGTTIYSEPGAPVIAVKDGTITAIGVSPTLGRYVSLRDASGNTYTYAQLGSLATLYPLLRPSRRLAGGVQPVRAGARPHGPASAGTQSRSPVSEAGVTQGLALGADGRFQRAQGTPSVLRPRRSRRSRTTPARHTRSFREGAEQVQLEPLRRGARVIAGTVLGHLATGSSPHVLFQIKPAGASSPLIDPKPVLDGWVQLEDTGIFTAQGEDPFLATSPTAGQALFESAGTLGQQILRDRAIALEPCERNAIRRRRAGRSALASIELLALSGLRPTVAHLGCDTKAAGGLGGYRRGQAYDITAVNGHAIAANTGRGGIADETERRLLALQGTLEPAQIVGPISYPGVARALTLPAARTLIHVSFANGASATGHLASAHAAIANAQLTGQEWTALVERIAELPYATVATQRSSASVADEPGEGTGG